MRARVEHEPVRHVHECGRARVGGDGAEADGRRRTQLRGEVGRFPRVSSPGSTGRGEPAASRNRPNRSASPRAALPSSPATAMTSPGRAPERSTGARPSSDPRAVTAIVRVSETVRSPPSTAQPGASASHAARRPSASPSTNERRVSSGIASATNSAVGRAPIAAMSARLTAADFQPRSNALDHARRKSGPCTRVSVVATTRPSGAAITAASSPGPDERRRRPQSRADRAEHLALGDGSHGGVGGGHPSKVAAGGNCSGSADRFARARLIRAFCPEQLPSAPGAPPNPLAPGSRRSSHPPARG